MIRIVLVLLKEPSGPGPVPKMIEIRVAWSWRTLVVSAVIFDGLSWITSD
jgi:hypothetical protein